MNQVPPHFHNEKEIIPDSTTYSALPVSAREGERAIVWDGTTATFYRYIRGAWRLIGGGGSSQWTTTGNDIYYTTGGIAVGTNSVNSNFKGVFYGNTGAWKGGIASGYTSASVVLGELSGLAQIGAHNGALNAWTNLFINSGGNTTVGGTTIPVAKLHVDGQLAFKDGDTSAPGIRSVVNSATGITTSTTTASADTLHLVGSNLGANVRIQNTNGLGFSGIEYMDNGGNSKIFTGYYISTGEFRFHAHAAGTFINFMTNFVTRLHLSADGKVGVSTTSPTAAFDINADILRLRTSKTPASSSDSANQGDICWDSNYLYLATSTNNWKRIALSTF